MPQRRPALQDCHGYFVYRTSYESGSGSFSSASASCANVRLDSHECKEIKGNRKTKTERNYKEEKVFNKRNKPKKVRNSHYRSPKADVNCVDDVVRRKKAEGTNVSRNECSSEESKISETSALCCADSEIYDKSCSFLIRSKPRSYYTNDLSKKPRKKYKDSCSKRKTSIASERSKCTVICSSESKIIKPCSYPTRIESHHNVIKSEGKKGGISCPSRETPIKPQTSEVTVCDSASKVYDSSCSFLIRSKPRSYYTQDLSKNPRKKDKDSCPRKKTSMASERSKCTVICSSESKIIKPCSYPTRTESHHNVMKSAIKKGGRNVDKDVDNTRGRSTVTFCEPDRKCTKVKDKATCPKAKKKWRVPALQVFVESRRSSRTSCESVTRSFSCDEPEKKKKSKIDNEPKEGEINEIFLSTSCCEFPARASTSVDYCADMNKRELAKINRLANRTMYINARHKEMSRKNSKRKSKKKNKNKKKTKKKNSEVMAPVQKLSYLLGRSVDDYISDCPEDCEPMSSCDPNSWRKAPEGCLTCAKIKECKRPKEKRENKPKKKKAKKKRRCSKDCEFAIKEAAYCRPGTSRNQESQKQYIDRSTSVIVEICEEPRSAPNSQFATKEDRESCESTSRKKYNDRPILVKSEICESSLSTSNSQLTRKEGRISCQCASVNKPSRKKYCDRPVSEDAKSSPDSVDFCTTVSPGRISADKAQNQWVSDFVLS
ncbi:hypothetical protein O3M35_002769 [Rhynocoris fuscipes]|uniref:Uncharacterized protein n=1 Tax=Rhynocoris fuscipes TaxID=488301 RepID=A0AAW1CQI1_9HEMI